MCKGTKNFLQHQIICQVFDSRKKGLCVLGQLFGFFPRFVHKWGICPYKFEKNPGFFLESEENRRNQKNNLGVRVKTTPNENKQNGQGDFADSIVQMFQNVFGVRV